jgi:hypothetical protein
MVVCHYYAKGYCKFANNCKFEHPRDLNSSYTPNVQSQQNYQQQNKYKFYSNNYPQSTGNIQNGQQQQQRSAGGSYDDKMKQNEFL